jgi:hypothetical protein
MNCYPGLQFSHMNPIKRKKKERDITSLSNDPPISETALLFYHKDTVIIRYGEQTQI